MISSFLPHYVEDCYYFSQYASQQNQPQRQPSFSQAKSGPRSVDTSQQYFVSLHVKIFGFIRSIFHCFIATVNEQEAQPLAGGMVSSRASMDVECAADNLLDKKCTVIENRSVLTDILDRSYYINLTSPRSLVSDIPTTETLFDQPDTRSNEKPPHSGKKQSPQFNRPHRTPRLSVLSSCLLMESITSVHQWMPSRHYISDWQRVFSTMQDGVSLATLYAKCIEFQNDSMVLIIRDTRGCLFGCYTSKSWYMSQRYYGTGESFVFKVDVDENVTSVYPWSRSNGLFQLGCARSIALGGGTGGVALFVDDMLEHGTSRPCSTFESPCLSLTEEFEIVTLEAYAIVPRYRFNAKLRDP